MQTQKQKRKITPTLLEEYSTESRTPVNPTPAKMEIDSLKVEEQK